MLQKLKEWANQLKKKLTALYYARQNPQTPWYCHIIIFATLLYALSPIDLIPDFIPVLGMLDDLLLLPVGIYITIQLLPKKVWQQSLNKAAMAPLQLPKNKLGILVIVLVWSVLLYFAWHYWLR